MSEPSLFYTLSSLADVAQMLRDRAESLLLQAKSQDTTEERLCMVCEAAGMASAADILGRTRLVTP